MVQQQRGLRVGWNEERLPPAEETVGRGCQRGLADFRETSRVRVAPNMGQLTQVHARMPHPIGEIDVQLVKRGGKLTANVELPAGITGEFEWAGAKKPLASGKNHSAF